MLYPISKIEVLEKMNTLDAIHGKESGRKWHELRRWLDQKAAEHHAHLTPESLASSQSVVNASALEKSDGDSSPAQAQVKPTVGKPKQRYLMAERIQRKRSKGWKPPPNTVYVGRPTMWGNPFSVRESLYKDHWSVVFEGKSISAEFATKRDAQAEAVRLFEKWFNTEIAEIGSDLHNFRNKYGWKGFSLACAVNMLRGKNLSCWCGADEPCHAEVILRLANNAYTGLASPVQADNDSAQPASQ